MQMETDSFAKNIKGVSVLYQEMAESISIEKLYNELKALRKEVRLIKGSMPDPDTIMTKEESSRFNESMLELNKRKTTSLSQVKKELGHKNAKC